MRKEWKIEENIPRLFDLRMLRKKYESFFPVKKNDLGVYNDYLPKLRSILIPLIRGKKLTIENDNTLIIKLCGDGVCVGNEN